MTNGIYRIYSINWLNEKPANVLIARFMVKNGCLTILEDHDKLLTHSLPEGPMSNDYEKFFKLLDHSSYFKLVPEQKISDGEHDDLIEDADWGDVEPESRYLLIPTDDSEPMRIETYGDHIVADGKQLSDEEVDEMMDRVRSEKAKLLPV